MGFVNRGFSTFVTCKDNSPNAVNLITQIKKKKQKRQFQSQEKSFDNKKNKNDILMLEIFFLSK